MLRIARRLCLQLLRVSGWYTWVQTRRVRKSMQGRATCCSNRLPRQVMPLLQQSLLVMLLLRWVLLQMLLLLMSQPVLTVATSFGQLGQADAAICWR